MDQRFVIGNNLRDIRKELGISTDELGKVVGLSNKAIESYESGGRLPKIDKLEEIRLFFVKKGKDIQLGDFLKEVKPYYCTLTLSQYSTNNIRTPLYEKGVYFKDMAAMKAILVKQSRSEKFVGGMLLGVEECAPESNLSYRKKALFIGAKTAEEIARHEHEEKACGHDREVSYEGLKEFVGIDTELQVIEPDFRIIEDIFAKLSNRPIWTMTFDKEGRRDKHSYYEAYSEIAYKLDPACQQWLKKNVLLDIDELSICSRHFEADLSNFQMETEEMLNHFELSAELKKLGSIGPF